MLKRPKDLSARQLHFEPQSPVRWLSTKVLSATAGRLLLARILGGYLDKRELQAINEQGCFDHSETEELWLDYVADIGDGFDSTYSIAYLESQDQLKVDAETTLPRGEILVMGGDEVYPSANWRDYENRTKGPYQAALPEGNQTLYAIPGNHDWFDGLTSFLRLFGAERKIGGRQTRQHRSYWAVKLPHRWWMIGIDAEFDAYLDSPQLQYFTEVLQDMEPGDSVILCVPRPSWTWTDMDPRAFDRIDYFIRTFITPQGGDVPLLLTGDQHHYAHFEEIDGPRHMITAGGGGAYLAPTHTLPKELSAPPLDSMARNGSPVRHYKRGAVYPSRRQSWQQSLGVFTRLPVRNLSFVALVGIIHLLGLLSYLDSPGTAVFASVATLGITIAFAHPSAGSRTFKYWVLGASHAAAQLGLTAVGMTLWRALDLHGWASYLAYVPVAGILGSLIVSVYLLVATRFGINDNELFASQSIDDYKCFLRMKLDSQGLTIFPIAVPKVGRHWQANPQGNGNSSWISPQKPIATHLIEKPYTIPGNTQYRDIQDTNSRTA